MNIRGFVVAAAVAVLATFNGPAKAVDNPASLDGGKIVTADQAKDLMAKGAVVLDVRSANEFAEGHIKGAKNVPYKEKSEKKAAFDASQDSFDLSKLPADKGAVMVFYCNGLECWKSYKASVTAIKGGFKNIHWLRGGMPEWKSKGYAVE